jgi:predicted MFS family arabinose efflux permease
MERVGLATATYFCFFDFGMGLGSVVLGLVATHTSFSSMYIFSSFFILISVLFYFFWQKKFS